MREITYREALREALREEMRRDPSVFLIGEDIGRYGGAYAVTRELINEFGERIKDTPISEAVIIGAATGAAVVGARPVAEIMYVDFMTLCMDQVVNQAAKMRYMFGGKVQVPMVIRTQGGTGAFCAAQHSQSLESWFLSVPGVKIVMPSTPYECKGLLKSSIRDNNIVIFIEHKMLYNTKGPVPEEDYAIPIGVADIARQGKDVTLIAWSKMLLTALEAAGKLAESGIDAEVISLRTLKPMDTETIINSFMKTGRLVICEEGCKTGGVGAEICALVNENAFDYMDAPIVRIAGRDVPIPFSPVLEKAAVPDAAGIIEGVKSIL